MFFTHLEHLRRLGWDLGRSHTSPPLETLLTVIYLITVGIGLLMTEYKTIISANIPVKLAARLKDKTKGTRSRVIARALKAYLDDMDAFDITDYDTRRLIIQLRNREDISEQLRAMLLVELNS
jgi:hypothetical protein